MYLIATGTPISVLENDVLKYMQCMACTCYSAALYVKLSSLVGCSSPQILNTIYRIPIGFRIALMVHKSSKVLSLKKRKKRKK